MCVRVYVYMCVHACVCVYILVCMLVCACTYVHVYIYVHTCVCVSVVVFLLFFVSGSYVVQVGLEFTKFLRVTLNYYLCFFLLPCVKITDMHHHSIIF